MKIASLLIIFGFACYGFQCDKENHENCTALRKALISKDLSVVEPEINYLLEDLVPQPDSGYLLGHATNLEVFINRLRDNCEFNASLGCYACIETFPVLSEVYITFDSLGTEVVRVMDITTPDNAVMTFRGLH